jgi:hypothetical protein
MDGALLPLFHFEYESGLGVNVWQYSTSGGVKKLT